MQPFVFHSPTRISFGAGVASTAAEVVNELGGKKTLIVTDSNLLRSGILTPVLESFQLSDLQEPVVFDQVPPDSDVASVNQAAQLARQSHCDSVVALGGGSVMDTAKVANICMTYGGDMVDYQGLNNLQSKLLPMVAIPTTAGTGSEVSLVAMIQDRTDEKKLLFGSRFLAPDQALIDPCLLVSLPPKLTAATGMDALTHNIESFTAISGGSPICDAICLESTALLFEFLLRATTCGDDLDARGATLVASTMAGIAFTNTGVGVVHALAHAVGSRFGTHHGLTNSVFLPWGMEFNLEVVGKRYAKVSRFLGISTSADEHRAAEQLIDAIRKLAAQLSLPGRLADLGVPRISDEEMSELAMAAATDPAIMFNPKEVSIEDIKGIYMRAY